MVEILFNKNGICRAGQCKGWNVVIEKEHDEYGDGYYIYLQNPKTNEVFDDYYDNFGLLKKAVEEMDVEWIVNEKKNKKRREKMGYNLKKLTEELKLKGLADDGLVAWGQNSSGALFGAVGAGIAGMHTISLKGNNIVIIPFTNKEIKYNEGIMIERSKISKAKVSTAFLTSKLKIVTVDGKTREYSITQGKDAVKEILEKLGL